MTFYNSIHLYQNSVVIPHIDSDSDELPSALKKPRSSISDCFHLISFNKKSVGIFNFKEDLIIKEDTFVQVIANINSKEIYGYLDLKKHIGLLNEVKLLNPVDTSKKINDYILSILGLDKETLETIKAFMHLGIDNEIHQKIIMSFNVEDISQLSNIFDLIFIGETIVQKIENYKQKKLFFENDKRILDILDDIYRNGLAIKVFNEQVLLSQIPDGDRCFEISFADLTKSGSVDLITKCLTLCSDDKRKIAAFILSKNRDIPLESLKISIIQLALNGYESTIKLILEDREILQEEIASGAILNASLGGYESIVRFIFSKNRSIIPKEKLERFIINAVSSGNLKLIDLFLSLDKNLLKTAVIKSVLMEKNSLVKILLAKDKKLFSLAINYAVQSKNQSLVHDILLESKYSKQYLSKAIIFAAKYKNESIARFLLSEGRQIYREDLMEAVLNAVKNKDESMVRFLLSEDRTIYVDEFSDDLFDAIADLCKNECESIFNFILSKLIPIKISSSIKKVILDFKNSLFEPGEGSLESLFCKLKAYSSHSTILDIALERLKKGIPFQGTPPVIGSEDRLSKEWYDHIRELLIKIDSKLDPSPTKDVEEKKNILEGLALCGGSWQAHFKQILEQLMVFPKNSSLEIFIGKSISDTAKKVAELLNKNYADVCQIAPNVHHQNKINFYLKDFIASDYLDDHLATLSTTKEQLLLLFAKDFNLEMVLKSISDDIYNFDGFREKIVDYYQKELFKGHLSNPDIELEFNKSKLQLEEHLESLEEIKEKFVGFEPLISIAGSLNNQLEILSKLSTLSTLSTSVIKKDLFKVWINQKFRTPENDSLFTDELITELLKKELTAIDIINLLRKMNSLFKFSFESMISQTKDQLIKTFLDAKQDYIENYLITDFEENHIDSETFKIKPSGVKLILKKLNFFQD